MGLPADALKLTPESAALRSLQTRRFEGTQRTNLLSACAGVLQDLGYNIESSESTLGILVGSKKASAVNPGQIATRVALSLFADVRTPAPDKSQKIRVSISIKRFPSKRKNIFDVRVTFQRTVWDMENNLTALERITNPKIYQNFFSKLSKSIFLEAHKI